MDILSIDIEGDLILNKWSLSFDLKLIKNIVISTLILYLIFNIVVFKNNNIICYIGGNGTKIETSIFKYSEIFLPLPFIIIVMNLFINDLDFNSFQILITFPISRAYMIIYRYIRIFIVFSLIYIPTVINMTYTLNLDLTNRGFEPMSSLKVLLKTLPTIFFMGSFALLVVVITRKIFYTLSIALGYYFFELLSRGMFTKKFMLFINNFSGYSEDTIIRSRMVLFIIGLVFLIVSLGVIKTKKYVISG